MEENKSPGKDGIPMEFNITFWPIIKNDFTKLVNYILFEKKRTTGINQNSNNFHDSKKRFK